MCGVLVAWIIAFSADDVALVFQLLVLLILVPQLVLLLWLSLFLKVSHSASIGVPVSAIGGGSVVAHDANAEVTVVI